MYILQSEQVFVVDGEGGSPCSFQILHLMALQYLGLLVGLEDGSSWVRFRFFLFVLFFFCLGGSGVSVSFFVKIVFVIVVCILTGCWCIAERSCCHACLSAASNVFDVVVILLASGTLVFIVSISLT